MNHSSHTTACNMYVQYKRIRSNSVLLVHCSVIKCFVGEKGDSGFETSIRFSSVKQTSVYMLCILPAKCKLMDTFVPYVICYVLKMFV